MRLRWETVPRHSFMINKGKCTWTKPMEIAGTQTKEDVGTNFDEVHGNKSQGHGYVVGTLANGDKMYVRIQGSSTLKDSVVESAEGAWSFTGGTGKLNGVKVRAPTKLGIPLTAKRRASRLAVLTFPLNLHAKSATHIFRKIRDPTPHNP
jgi:hypothetical protein